MPHLWQLDEEDASHPNAGDMRKRASKADTAAKRLAFSACFAAQERCFSSLKREFSIKIDPEWEVPPDTLGARKLNYFSDSTLTTADANCPILRRFSTRSHDDYVRNLSFLGWSIRTQHNRRQLHLLGARQRDKHLKKSYQLKVASQVAPAVLFAYRNRYLMRSGTKNGTAYERQLNQGTTPPRRSRSAGLDATHSVEYTSNPEKDAALVYVVLSQHPEDP